MSTANFARCYFSNVYALELPEDGDFSFFLDDLRDTLAERLRAERADGWHTVGYNSGEILAKLTAYKHGYRITHDIVIMSGYYADANLDIVVQVSHDNGDEWDSAARDSFEDLPAYIRDAIESRNRRIEKVLTKVTQRLAVRGVFSNGEAVYAAV